MALEVADHAVTSSAGYSRASLSALARSVSSLTSNGTNRRGASASSSSRVLSDVPEPSSISVAASVSSAISSAYRSRIERSARVR